ncbi:hypothetical protein [Cellulomonas sp. URHE0023]|uniref:hypothetical protein n=1 Tax=Cellulomonas sp. URHE0023 TaxID=1380354 RepID=UPI00054F8F1C|nr:hypothetical protein [Cellulomonas sp. URHE0023]
MSGASVITTSDLPGVLEALGAQPESIQYKQDIPRSISSKIVRFVKDGRRGVAVGADVKHQIDAFTDLLALHLNYPEASLAREDVWLWFADRSGDGETEVAMRTLARNVSGVRVHLRGITSDGMLRELDGEQVPWEDDKHYSYGQWAKLLAELPDEPPSLVTKLIVATRRPEYRAYPMLSSHGKNWSIRFEGLQVAVCSATGGVLTVGKERADGRPSHHRDRWVAAAGIAPLVVNATDESIEEAASVLRAFAASPVSSRATIGLQDEHALESRILRGTVPLFTPDGQSLELIRSHPVVNWGSQFPTRWGVRTRAARYLDGMLHVDETPWAVEMKVDGVGGERYFRHAVHQAVLYRDFIRGAVPLSGWFDRFKLDHKKCEAAVVVPEGMSAAAEERLKTVAGAFDVSLILVPVEDALRPGA